MTDFNTPFINIYNRADDGLYFFSTNSTEIEIRGNLHHLSKDGFL